jgi:hypothetical protein
MWRKGNPCILSANFGWCSHYIEHMDSSQKLKIELAYDPAIALLDIGPR